MYSVTTTGKNLNYGADGEKRLIADHRLKYCLKYEWIYPKYKYAGSDRLVVRDLKTGKEIRRKKNGYRNKERD